MAESMLRLLVDNPLRTEVIRQGRELVRTDFDNLQLIEELAAIYCQNIPAMNCV
jgi:hypothetical protein